MKLLLRVLVVLSLSGWVFASLGAAATLQLTWQDFGRDRPALPRPFTLDVAGASHEAEADWEPATPPIWKADVRHPGTRRALGEWKGVASLTRLTLEFTAYDDFTVVEWLPRLGTAGRQETPVLEHIDSGHFELASDTGFAPIVRYAEGSSEKATDFQPLSRTLTADEPLRIGSFGGRSSDGALPYFHIQLGPDRGCIIAVGWTGDWAATFERVDGGVRIRTGLAHGHFRLRADEQVRFPSVVVLFYEGDWLDGQNRWRRFVRTHMTPRAAHDGKALPIAASVHGVLGFNDTSEARLTALADAVARLGLPFDTYWLDAGWNQGGFPLGQGNPEPDPGRYPRGLGPVGEAVHRHDLLFLVWFEPERVMPQTWLRKSHPEWLLCPSSLPDTLQYQADWRLLDMGDPEARSWVTQQVERRIRDWGVSIYRQDFNMHPAFYWQTDEADDRQGIREIRYIAGLYEYLDALQQAFPDMLMDNCASGGRRLDLGMVRRSVALFRSDSCWDHPEYPRNVQAMHYGLSLWHPFTGLGATSADPVPFRSGLGSHITVAARFDDPKYDTELLRRRLTECQAVRHLFAEDFYPLTPYSLAEEAWLAWQYHAPATGEGLVQAFRRPRADGTLRVQLRGLKSSAQYLVKDFDGGESTLSGKQLAAGWTIAAKEAPAALLFHYREQSRP